MEEGELKMTQNDFRRSGTSGWAVTACLLFCCLLSISNAAVLPIVSLYPSNGAANVCEDTHFRMSFQKWLTLATSGSFRIYKASDDSLVWQVNLTTLPWPPSGYTINVAGKTLNYYPVMTCGNYVEIIPPSGILAYDTEYYIKVTAGFVTFGSDTSPAISDTTTWRFRTRAAAPAADQDYIVAADGTGDFCTIQAAINATPDNSPTRTVIRVKNGTYRELLNVVSSKKKITLLGQDRDKTIIAAINNNNLNSNGSSYRCMMEISGDDFRVYNITFRNLTPQGGSQAETIKVNNAKRCVASNCEFYSFQDTLLISGSMYLSDCYIEGDVDYIWGYGTVFFERCHLRTMRSGAYINQARNDAATLGYFYVDCTLSQPTGVSGSVFARIDQASFPYSQVVFINTTMPTNLIVSTGWSIYGSGPVDGIRFWEYKSVDPSGNPINVSMRHSASRQLTDEEAAYWRNPANVFSGWNPKALADLPTRAWLITPEDGIANVTENTELRWTSGAEATSHLLYFGTTNPPPFVTETTANVFSPTLVPGATYYWRIDEKNINGVTTGAVHSFTTRRWFCGSNCASQQGGCIPQPAAFGASDVNGDCQVDFTDFALLSAEWQMYEDPNNYLVNGDFELPILTNGWKFIAGGAPVTLTRLTTGGNPDGAALLTKPNNIAAYGDSRLYQIIPVTVGKRYELLGEWKGDLSGYANRPVWTGGATSMPRNVIAIYVTFVNSTAQPTNWGNYYYKKYYGFFFDGIKNIGDDGTWDWEPISASPAGAPTNGFLATDNYMVIAVAMSARAYGGSISVTLDNFRVREYRPPVTADVTGDLKVDFSDAAVMAAEWLTCGRLPATECWVW